MLARVHKAILNDHCKKGLFVSLLTSMVGYLVQVIMTKAWILYTPPNIGICQKFCSIVHVASPWQSAAYQLARTWSWAWLNTCSWSTDEQLAWCLHNARSCFYTGNNTRFLNSRNNIYIVRYIGEQFEIACNNKNTFNCREFSRAKRSGRGFTFHAKDITSRMILTWE